MQQRRVDDAEHGGRGADAQRERQDRDDRGAAHPAERAGRVADVLQHRFHAVKDGRPADALTRASAIVRQSGQLSTSRRIFQ
jgi:hypothetical protein